MGVLFEISVADDLTPEQARKILGDLEEVIGKNNLDLDEADWDYM